MSQVIPFRPAPSTSVATLSARLIQMESVETTDEDLLDLLMEAELAALASLARAQAGTVAEVVLKLAAVVRRLGEERDAPPCDDELRLLRSTLQDLQRLATVPGTALQA